MKQVKKYLNSRFGRQTLHKTFPVLKLRAKKTHKQDPEWYFFILYFSTLQNKTEIKWSCLKPISLYELILQGHET